MSRASPPFHPKNLFLSVLKILSSYVWGLWGRNCFWEYFKVGVAGLFLKFTTNDLLICTVPFIQSKTEPNLPDLCMIQGPVIFSGPKPHVKQTRFGNQLVSRICLPKYLTECQHFLRWWTLAIKLGGLDGMWWHMMTCFLFSDGVFMQFYFITDNQAEMTAVGRELPFAYGVEEWSWCSNIWAMVVVVGQRWSSPDRRNCRWIVWMWDNV